MSQRRQDLLLILEDQAGNNSLADRYTVGYLAAVNDILNISVEELNNGN